MMKAPRLPPEAMPCPEQSARLLVFLCFLLHGALAGAAVQIQGRVVDENGVGVAGARITLGATAAAHSDLTGRFTLTANRGGEFPVSVEREGFFALKNQKIRIAEGENEVTLVLNHLREFVDQVDVVYSPPVIDTQQPAAQQSLTGMEIIDVPFAAAHDLRNALPMFQGVVQDSRGDIHVQGGAADQTYWTLDGFNVTDPVSGRFESRLSIDAVRSLDLQTSRYSADTGKGSAGTVDLKTGMGDDRYRFSATNFVPGWEYHKNFAITKWTPRATVSGPILRGRAWFFDGLDTFYDQNVIDELPRGQDRTSSWRVNNIIRGQFNVTPGNIFTTSLLINYLNAPRDGLDLFNPMETTVDRRQRFWFYSAKDQFFYGSGGIIEIGFALSRRFRRDIPQGDQTYIFLPEGHRGNYFVDSSVNSGREQWLANLYAPPFERSGRHQIKTGVDISRDGFTQDVDRHDYQVLREDQSVARVVSFAGPRHLERRNFEAALYVQDSWTPRDGLLVEAGLRADWDQVVRDPLLSPRLAAAYAPKWARGTKFSAGGGIFYDALNLRTLSQHLDQRSISFFYDRAGQPTSGPVETFFVTDDRRLRAPRYQTFSAGVERPLGHGFYGRVNYLRKRGRRGFTFLPMQLTGAERPLELFNSRDDHYDAVDFSVRRTFRGQFEWMAGYTRSAARTNAVLDFSLEDPLFAQQADGPLRWDAPHRFQTWGWAPLPAPAWTPALFRKVTLAYWLETRSGFPFRIVNEDAQLVGAPNSRRFPSYFNLNLHLERRFTFLHHEWAGRAGFNNITNHNNANVVNNNIDSPGFLTFAGGQHRALTVRLRFLGKT